MSNYVAYSRDEIIMENYTNLNKDITQLRNLVTKKTNLQLNIDENAENNRKKLIDVDTQYEENQQIKSKDTGIMDVMKKDNIKINRNQQLLTSLGMITAATLIVFTFFKK
jgi:hypothetical protein